MSQFTYSDRDLLTDVLRDKNTDTLTGSSPSTFDALLTSGWSDRMRGGVFRYRLDDLQTRVIPGLRSYVAQLNVQRGVERRRPQEIRSIKQRYNEDQFNFNKVRPGEVLFEMTRHGPTGPSETPPGEVLFKMTRHGPTGPSETPPGEVLFEMTRHGPTGPSETPPGEVLFEMTRHGPTGPSETPPGEDGPELQRVMVVVNVSPLEFGHCLFVPEPSRCFPQVLTLLAVRTGIEAVLLSSDPGFRVGFNSLGAFASVNHLHLHGYYLKHELVLETVPVEPLVPEKGFYRLTLLPRGFLFYAEPKDIDEVARVLFQVTETLVNGGIAHNLFLTRGCPPGDVRSNEAQRASRRGVRVALWPRRSCFGAKEQNAFNVALCELAGHLPFKVRQDYECMTEHEVNDIIQRYLLPDEDFIRLEKQLVADLIDL